MWEYSYQINNLVAETTYNLEIIASFDQKNSSSKTIEFYTDYLFESTVSSFTVDPASVVEVGMIGEITNQAIIEITTNSVDSTQPKNYFVTKSAGTDFETHFVEEIGVVDTTAETDALETTRIFEDSYIENSDSTSKHDLISLSSKPAACLCQGLIFVFLTVLCL